MALIVAIVHLCSFVSFLCIMTYQPSCVDMSLYNAKSILVEKQLWYYLTFIWSRKEVDTFHKSISSKVNIIMWMEIELSY